MSDAGVGWAGAEADTVTELSAATVSALRRGC